jgi:diguanylate cyclase (GGDEF)-like protein/PAS domain S-box-containing protein
VLGRERAAHGGRQHRRHRVDVTSLKQAEEALRAGEERFRSLAEAALDAIVVVDAENRVRFWSTGAVRMFGWSEAEMLGAPPDRIVPEALRAAHRAGLRRYVETGEARVIGRTVELMAVRRDGAGFPIELSLSSWRQGSEVFFCSIVRDVTERKHAEARVRHLAFYDALTGLPNRVLLMERLDHALATAAREGTMLAVLCLDLDRFKEVNDTRGHAAGDRVLQVAAERLRSRVREVDTVARLGGDEFAVLQVGVGSAAAVQRLCERLLEAFAAPISVEDQPAHVGLSIGVALAPTDGSAADDLLRFADLALYRAKGEGRGAFRMFEPVMDAQLRTRKQLEHELREALERDQLLLDYQPLVDVGTGRIVGAEALVRWRHPERGLLPPGLFVPIAEQTGVIGELGAWVLREACREAAGWPVPVAISVNLSPVQVRRHGLAGEIAAVLRVTGLAPERLELEITEGVLLKDDEQALHALQSLKELGVCLALDDFAALWSKRTKRRLPANLLMRLPYRTPRERGKHGGPTYPLRPHREAGRDRPTGARPGGPASPGPFGRAAPRRGDPAVRSHVRA